jgi:hypothetical protein
LPKPAAPPEPSQEPSAAGALARGALPPWEGTETPKQRAELLRRVPVLSLAAPAAPGRGGSEDAAQEKAAWRDMDRAVREQREKFLDGLLAKRPDLAGLPFRKGKDCQLERAAARTLDESSREVRRSFALLLGPGDRKRPPDPESSGDAAAATLAVYHRLVADPRWRDPATYPALEQVLTGEPAPVRRALVQYHLSPPDSPVSAWVLARRAVFDPSAGVRQEAVAGLRYQPAGQYLPILLSGLRHPWPPVNHHAAEALVALGAEAAVPDLIRVLDAPGPLRPIRDRRKRQARAGRARAGPPEPPRQLPAVPRPVLCPGRPGPRPGAQSAEAAAPADEVL